MGDIRYTNHNGKGDQRRPAQVPADVYAENYERIFGTPSKTQRESAQPVTKE